jgi:hypothetical protein
MNNYSGPAGQPLAHAGTHAPQNGAPTAALAQIPGQPAQPYGAAHAVRPDALPPELRVRIALLTAGVFVGAFWVSGMLGVIVAALVDPDKHRDVADFLYWMLILCVLGGSVVTSTLYCTGRVCRERGKLLAAREAQAAANAAMDAASYARGAARAAEGLALAIPVHSIVLKETRERSVRAAGEAQDQAILAEEHAGEAEKAAAAAVAAKRPGAAIAARQTAVRANREAAAAAWEARRQHAIAERALEEAGVTLAGKGDDR